MLRLDSDGIDVVRDAREAATLAAPPLLVLDALEGHLDAVGLGVGPVAWERIGDGQSNVTFLVKRGKDAFVIRRGPRPPLPQSAHDMVREATIQRLLGQAGVPVPEIFDVCDDPGVLGVPFYTMSYVDGIVITDKIPGALDSMEQRRRTTEVAVDTLVALHAIDVSTGKLASIGRPDGYLSRQLRRFRSLWPLYSLRQIPAVDIIGDWLAANMPASQATSVVHGDYRLGNLMFAKQAPARVATLLDWEMATLGDPLADLGYFSATFAEPGGYATALELTSVTRRPGYLRRDQLLQRYQEASGLVMDQLPWYQTLALWKAAIFSEAIYTRWLNGERQSDSIFAPTLEVGVPRLLEGARRMAGLEGFDAFERSAAVGRPANERPVHD